MIKRLLQVGLVLAGFASMPSWAILINDGGVFDGTDVGVVDTLLAEAAKVGDPLAEQDWVNSILAPTSVTWTIKTEPVTYFSTDASDVFAFELASVTGPDYFLVKNATHMALFENLADINWGVFDTSLLSSDLNLPDLQEFEISHVTEFNAVPEPGMAGLLAIGLLGMVVTRRRMKV